jgi:hypothetical protein
MEMKINTFYQPGYVAKFHWNLQFFANEASRFPLNYVDEQQQKVKRLKWINRPMLTSSSKWLGSVSGDDKRNSSSSWSSPSVCFDDCDEGGEDLIVSGD